jgi:hypothetical protein
MFGALAQRDGANKDEGGKNETGFQSGWAFDGHLL